MAKIGVILSGCGVYDGAEIQESVLTLLSLDRLGHEAVLLAPDRPQMHVINHLTGEAEHEETRNVLVEAARIARGAITDVAEASPADFDALILPGGYGAAKNLSSFAIDGSEAQVDEGVARLIEAMFGADKPLGFICIAPAVAARVLGKHGIELTIGNDRDTAQALEKTGAKHIDKPVTEIHRDPRFKIASTPAYMLGQNIGEVATGIDALVREVDAMLKE